MFTAGIFKLANKFFEKKNDYANFQDSNRKYKMPIDQKLLDILCCPKTKVDVQILPVQDLKKLNARIRSGTVQYENGEIVTETLEEGLITIDKKTVYRIEDGIPIMLIDKGIIFISD